MAGHWESVNGPPNYAASASGKIHAHVLASSPSIAWIIILDLLERKKSD